MTEDLDRGFKISKGNIRVLETVPTMMLDREYRLKLRNLTLRFLMQQEKRNDILKADKKEQLRKSNWRKKQ